MVALLRMQAQACGSLGSPLYADLLVRAADDAAAGGLVAGVLAGHEHDPGESALALRLLGSVHRLVLERRAAGLAVHYPSVGGRPGPPEQVWAAFAAVLDAERDEVRAGLAQPPQTNEVGRSAALLGGLLHLSAQHHLPVRLTEIGASGGLNLRADAFRYDADGGRAWGPQTSPVVLADAWRGALPPTDAHLEVVERVGSDIAPVDTASTEGRLLLSAYVWPDQVERFERLRGAFTVAAGLPAPVHRASALETVRALETRDGATTVLWHSVMWQYVDPDEQAAVEQRLAQIGAAASARAPFAHLRLEPFSTSRDADPEFLVVLTTWPGGAERVLAFAAPHGLPTTWRERR